MKHHFADFLDRSGDYWTVVPNRERYAYRIGDLTAGDPAITIVTIGQGDADWQRIWTFPNLVELTLHEPSQEQLDGISQLTGLQRLRITHARPKHVEFLAPLVKVEELVLEYVSGFSDLSPLRSMGKLKSLHMENLRRVSDFSGLSGITSLRYLYIDGTLDWKQPIADFEFLAGLPNLEVLSFGVGMVINKTPYPAMLPARQLKKLQRLSLVNSTLAPKEYALLSVILAGVEGANWGPYRRWAYSSVPLPRNDIRWQLSDDAIRRDHPDVRVWYDGKRMIDNPDDQWYEFTGKGAGRVKCSSPKCQEKCDAYAALYDTMLDEAKAIIAALGDV